MNTGLLRRCFGGAVLLCLAVGAFANDKLPKPFVDKLISDMIAKLSVDPPLRSSCFPYVWGESSRADQFAARLLAVGKPAVPHLTRAIRQDKHGWARIFAMEILTKQRERSAIPAMLKVLESDPEMDLRCIAGDCLAEMRVPEAISGLINIAWQPSNAFCFPVASATRALGHYRSAKLLPVLAARLSFEVHGQPGRRVPNPTAAAALAAQGPMAVPYLEKAIFGDDQFATGEAIVGIGQIRDKRVVPILRRALLFKGLWPDVADALGGQRCDEAYQLLVKLLADPDSSVRIRAESSLGKLGDRRAIPLLRARLGKPSNDQYEVDRIAEALIGLKAKEAIPDFRALLVASRGDDAARLVCDALVEWDKPNSLPVLVLALAGQGPNYSVSLSIAKYGVKGTQAVLQALAVGKLTDSQAAEAVREMRNGDALKPALSFLGGRPTSLTYAVLDAAGQCPVPEGREAFARLMKSEDRDIRGRAAMALAQLKDAAAIPELAQYAVSSFDPVAHTLLGAFGDAAVKPILDTLEKSAGRCREDLLRTLGETKSERAVPWLEKATKGKDDKQAIAAAEGLARIGSSAAKAALRRCMNNPLVEVRYAVYMALRD